MSYQRLEVLTGTERRRKWSDTEKVRLVEAAFRPGIVVKEVARRFGVHESLLYRWRRQLGVSVPAIDSAVPAFTPVRLAPVGEPMAVPVVEAAMPAPNPPTASVADISVLLPGGIEVRLRGSVDLALARAVIRAAGGAG
ncbi:transposase [Azorhizobium sp. AG788]|uniref:IS66-like element accessory protein TnpA n=1 Tax=Azorhizobium sp. AG788 TaxID=2183897 RepID=UPI003138BF78